MSMPERQRRVDSVVKRDGDPSLLPPQRSWQDYSERGQRFSNDYPETIEDLPITDDTSPLAPADGDSDFARRTPKCMT